MNEVDQSERGSSPLTVTDLYSKLRDEGVHVVPTGIHNPVWSVEIPMGWVKSEEQLETLLSALRRMKALAPTDG